MSSLLSTLKIDADTPENFGNSGTQYRRNCKTASGAEGVRLVLKELQAFVPEVKAMRDTGKRTDKVSQSTLCTTALAHGLYNDFAALKKVCPRLDKAHLRYIEKSAGMIISYVAKAPAALIAELKKIGHEGAVSGIAKVGAPVFFLNDTTALVKQATPAPSTGKGKVK